MRAVVIHAAHDLRIDEILHSPPGAGEVLVRIETGGICGSDLHYYHHGAIGTAILLKEPMILGHEVAGIVEKVGRAVTRTKPGDRVALSPSRPCSACKFCFSGQQMHCLNMRFYGSAMRFPHVQGAFRQSIVADEAQCHVVPSALSAGEAAMAEPLAGLSACGSPRWSHARQTRSGDRFRPDRRALRHRSETSGCRRNRHNGHFRYAGPAHAQARRR